MSGTPQGYSYGQPHTGYQRVASTYAGTTYSGYHQHGQTALVQPAHTAQPPPPPPAHQAPPYTVQPVHQLQQQAQTYQLHSVALNSQSHTYQTNPASAHTPHSVYQSQAPPPPPPPPPPPQQPTHSAYQSQHTAHSAYQTQPAATQPTTHSVYQTQPPVPSPAQAPQTHSVYQPHSAASQTQSQQPGQQAPPPPPTQTYQTYGSQIPKVRPQPISVTTTSPINHTPIQSQQPQAYNYNTQNASYPNVTVATHTTLGTEYRPVLKSRYYPTNEASNAIKAPSQPDPYHSTTSQQPILQTVPTQQAYSYHDSLSDSQYQYKEPVAKPVYQPTYSDSTVLKTTYQAAAQYPASTKIPTQYQASAKPNPSPYPSNTKQVTTYQPATTATSPKPPTAYQGGTKLTPHYSVTAKSLTQYQTGAKSTTQYQSSTKPHTLYQAGVKPQTQYQSATKMLISFPNPTKSVSPFQNSPKLLSPYPSVTKSQSPYPSVTKSQSPYSSATKQQFQSTASLAKPQYSTLLPKTSYPSTTKTHYQSHFSEAGTSKPHYQYRKLTSTETQFEQYQETPPQQQNHTPYRYQQIKTSYVGESLPKAVTSSVIRPLPEVDSMNNVLKMTINDDPSRATTATATTTTTTATSVSSRTSPTTPSAKTADLVSSVSPPVPMVTDAAEEAEDSALNKAELAEANACSDTIKGEDETMADDDDDADGDDSLDAKKIANGDEEFPTMKVLKELMQPMLCKLCNVAMNAAIQSDQHYSGKNHAKKVRLFMLSGGTQLPATKNRPAVEFKPGGGQEIRPVVTTSHTNGESTSSVPRTLVTSTTDSKSSTTSITTPNTTTSSTITSSTATTSSISSSSSSSSSASSSSSSSSSTTTTATNTACSSTTTTTTSTSTVSSVVSSTAELNSEIYCKICDACFNSPKQATQHYAGKNHAKKVRMAEAATKLAEAVGTGTVTESGNVFMCALCSVHVTSQEQLSSHLNGAKHKGKQRMQERQNNNKERESSNSGNRNYQGSRGNSNATRGGPNFRRNFRGAGMRGPIRGGMRGDRGRGRGGFGGGGAGGIGPGNFNGNPSFGSPLPDFGGSMPDFPSKGWGAGPSSFRGGNSGASGTLNNYCYQPPPNKRPRGQDYNNFHAEQICDATKPHA